MLPMAVIEIREMKMREALAKAAEDIGRNTRGGGVCCLEPIGLGVVSTYVSVRNQSKRQSRDSHAFHPVATSPRVLDCLWIKRRENFY